MPSSCLPLPFLYWQTITQISVHIDVYVRSNIYDTTLKIRTTMNMNADMNINNNCKSLIWDQE